MTCNYSFDSSGDQKGASGPRFAPITVTAFSCEAKLMRPVESGARTPRPFLRISHTA